MSKLSYATKPLTEKQEAWYWLSMARNARITGKAPERVIFCLDMASVCRRYALPHPF
jgi:hypothetical protein